MIHEEYGQDSVSIPQGPSHPKLIYQKQTLLLRLPLGKLYILGKRLNDLLGLTS